MDPPHPKGSEWEIDDATIYASHLKPLLDSIRARKKPIINCLAHHEGIGMRTVRSHDFSVGRLAAKYFLERGFERFLYYAGKDQSLAADLRFAGFLSVLGEAGYPARRVEVTRDEQNSIENMLAMVHDTPKPMALFVSHDHLAREVADAISSEEIRVPEQVAILGVDNDDLQCEISRPPLSSVQIAHDEIGYRAAADLDAMLHGKDLSAESVLVEPIGIFTRRSTAIFALNEPRLAEAMSFIREHACDPCSVDDVLEHLAVSRRWLESQFQLRFSRTPHQAITLERMERAKQLLRDPDQSLKSVSTKSGYGHLQNFVGAFKKVVGETPAAYRRRMRLHGLSASAKSLSTTTDNRRT
jgi:LacI family transcriptional regulator